MEDDPIEKKKSIAELRIFLSLPLEVIDLCDTSSDEDVTREHVSIVSKNKVKTNTKNEGKSTRSRLPGVVEKWNSEASDEDENKRDDLDEDNDEDNYDEEERQEQTSGDESFTGEKGKRKLNESFHSFACEKLATRSQEKGSSRALTNSVQEANSVQRSTYRRNTNFTPSTYMVPSTPAVTQPLKPRVEDPTSEHEDEESADELFPSQESVNRDRILTEALEELNEKRRQALIESVQLNQEDSQETNDDGDVISSIVSRKKTSIGQPFLIRNLLTPNHPLQILRNSRSITRSQENATNKKKESSKEEEDSDMDVFSSYKSSKKSRK